MTQNAVRELPLKKPNEKLTKPNEMLLIYRVLLATSSKFMHLLMQRQVTPGLPKRITG